MAFTKAGIINAGVIFFATTILLTAIFGRFFCGWACHLVALQDLSRWLLRRIGIRPPPLRSRLLRWVPFLAFAYMFLWPVVYRLWIGDSFSTFRLEPTTEQFWATFPGWVIGTLTFVICGFVIVYLLGSKGFCTYACPYGAAFMWTDRLAPLRIRVTDACEGCGHCTATCSSNVRIHDEVRRFGMVVDDGCLKTLDCVSVCPNDALYYGTGPSRRAAKAAAKPYRQESHLSWTEELVLAAGFVLAMLVFRGLYGSVPFLMALGLSAVLAFLVLTTVRLATQPNLSLRQFRLKSDGRLLPGGLIFAGAMLLLGIFWVHSGVVHYHQFMGERAFQATSRLRGLALDITSQLGTVGDPDVQTIRRGRQLLERSESWGLVSTPGNSWRLAWLSYLAGAPAELAEFAETAIARDEFVSQMHQVLAVSALQDGNRQVALDRLELAISTDPYLLQPHLLLGLVQAQSGRMEEAKAAFDRGIQYAPESSELWYNSGLASAYMGAIAVALERFEQALELSPANLAARENLAGLLASQGRFRESASHYQLAIEQSPEDAETHYLLARVWLELGELDNAFIALDRCLALEPGHRQAIILRADLEDQRDE